MNEVKRPKKPLIFYYTLVMVALVLVNFLLALFIYSMLLFTWGDTYIPAKDMTYGMKFNSEAKELGFRDGDIIVGTENGEFKEFGIDMFRDISGATRADIIRGTCRCRTP